MDKLITTAPELWQELAGTAQFDKREYDLEIQNEIRRRLGFPPTGNMLALLQKYNISCEALLDAVFHCIMPFSQMLSDLFAMFQRANAQKSDHNLMIQFDFNSQEKPYNIDIEFFHRQTLSANLFVTHAIGKIPCHPYSLVAEIGKIWEPNYQNNPRSLYPTEVKVWLEEYERCPRGTWPDYVPPIPISGFPELDRQLENLWQILVHSLRKYRTEYKEEKWSDKNNLPDAEFWWNEGNRWLGAYVRTIHDILTFFQVEGPDEHSAFASRCAKRIEEILTRCPMHNSPTQQRVQAIIDILNLPFWKKRYELYSVWVSTQILRALPDENVHFHTENNRLSFSFSGSHFATISSYTPSLELWAEVRTYYDSPKSRARKNHIQPDYTLAVGDAYEADHSVAVVECKQYKKYNRKNFLNAAEDYAGGRPNSKVFLVNYGAVPSSLKDKADARFRNQINFFGNVRPATVDTVAFRKQLRQAIDRYYEKAFQIKLPKYSLPEGECILRLTWGAQPKDLDLHLVIMNDTQKYHIMYNKPGNIASAPYAKLNSDDTNGHGNECITIKRWIPGSYDIYVHNYTNTALFSEAVTLSIIFNGITRYAISRTDPIQQGMCWHPFSISSGKVIAVNDLVDLSTL